MTDALRVPDSVVSYRAGAPCSPAGDLRGDNSRYAAPQSTESSQTPSIGLGCGETGTLPRPRTDVGLSGSCAGCCDPAGSLNSPSARGRTRRETGPGHRSVAGSSVRPGVIDELAPASRGACSLRRLLRGRGEAPEPAGSPRLPRWPRPRRPARPPWITRTTTRRTDAHTPDHLTGGQTADQHRRDTHQQQGSDQYVVCGRRGLLGGQR
jgi:hypothetical protein